jgi:hypothetical protein
MFLGKPKQYTIKYTALDVSKEKKAVASAEEELPKNKTKICVR